MKITITGTGYVGLVTGACLADMGNDVLCLDVDAGKIRVLEEGGIPIHEPGLETLVAANRASGRLRFTTDVDRAVAHGRLQMIAVGTPPGEDGSADLNHVLAAARAIGERMSEQKIVVDKSTVPVGTADRVRQAIEDELARRGVAIDFAMVSNPEFLKQGDAVADFMRPDRVVIGAEEPYAIEALRDLYAPFMRNHDRLLIMDIRSAELTKYAANAMLATRISFMNELANLAGSVGADIESVRKGIGSDSRIGYSFLYAGCGYGGSCFPKDVKALVRTAAESGHRMQVLEAVEAANEVQKQVLTQMITRRFGESLRGRRFALWGLAFKPNTDDMREAPSRFLIEDLIARGASISAWDPAAMAEAKKLYADRPAVGFAGSALEACEGADALIIVTEWKAFRSPDLAALRSRLREPLIFDGRNLYQPAVLKQAGFQYESIGRGESPARKAST